MVFQEFMSDTQGKSVLFVLVVYGKLVFLPPRYIVACNSTPSLWSQRRWLEFRFCEMISTA